MHSKVICVACSVFRADLELLQAGGRLNADLKFLEILLHMQPLQMQILLDELLKKETEQGGKVLLIYGSCSPGMEKHTLNSRIARIEGENCFEIILGAEEYRRLLKERPFFLLPSWVENWRKNFIDGFGMDRENASLMMNESFRKLLYLDTGAVSINKKELQEFAGYCRLPAEIKAVSLAPFSAAINAALEALNRKEA